MVNRIGKGRWLFLFAGFCISFLTIKAEAATSDIEPKFLNFAPELKVENPYRERMCLNGIWEFKPLGKQESFENPLATSWQKIKVPSSWTAWIAFDYPRSWFDLTKGIYRTFFEVPDSLKGKRIKLCFGAVDLDSEVFLNGKKVGENHIAPVPFVLDITEVVKFKEKNEMVLWVEAHKKPRELDWLEGRRGVVQDVYLVGVPDMYVIDNFVITSVRKNNLTSKLTMKNEGKQAKKLSISQYITELNGKKVKQGSGKKINIEENSTLTTELSFPWKDPTLWSIYDPHLYYIVTEVKQRNKIVDKQVTRFGFREFWIENGDFYLNGHRVCLKGNLDDIGQLGGMSSNQNNREYMTALIKTLKDANYNTFRTHYGMPPIPPLHSVADEMGLMIYAGLHDGHKPDEFFRRAVIRDRNHPSVVLRCLDNESFQWAKWSKQLEPYQMLEPKYREEVRRLRHLDKVVKEMDPTRPTTYSGSYDLFGYSEIINPHYPLYHASIPALRNFFIELPKRYPKYKEKMEKQPMLVGEYRYTAGLHKETLHITGEDNFRDLGAGSLAAGIYNNNCILGWRASGVDGFVFCAAFHRFLFYPFGIEAEKDLVIHHDDYHGPYQKPTYIHGKRLYVNPGWDTTSPLYSPVAGFYPTQSALKPLGAFTFQQGKNYLSGEKVEKEIIVLNDYFEDKKLVLAGEILGENDKPLKKNVLPIEIPETSVNRFNLRIDIPKVKETEQGKLRLALYEGNKEVSHTDYSIVLYPKEYTALADIKERIALYDTTGVTSKIMGKISISYQKITNFSDLNKYKVLLIGYHSEDEKVLSSIEEITSFAQSGGKVIYFEQDRFKGATTYSFIQAKGHPIFTGYPSGEGDTLSYFRGYDNFTCVGQLSKPSGGNSLVLVDCGSFMGSSALTETFVGKGLMIRSQLGLSLRYGLDPLATRIWNNMLAYVSRYKPDFPPTGFLKGDGDTEKILEELKVNYKQIENPEEIRQYKRIIIGKGASIQKEKIEEMLSSGGTAIYFSPHSSSLAGKVTAGQINMYKGETDAPNRYIWINDEKGVWGINCTDFKRNIRGTKDGDINVFRTWDDSWRPLIEVRGGFNTRISLSMESPRWFRLRKGIESEEWARSRVRAMHDKKYGSSYKVLGAVALKKDSDKGKYLLLSYPFSRKLDAKSKRVLCSIFTNYGVGMGEATGTFRKPFRSELENHFLIDISSYCNVGFVDNENLHDGKGGWTDEGSSNDLRNFSAGLWLFAGVPFKVIDAKDNKGKSCIGLYSRFYTEKAGMKLDAPEEGKLYYPLKVGPIPVNQKAETISFLHTSACTKDGEKGWSYRINYQNGNRVEIPIIGGRQVAEWWGAKDAPEAELGWKGKNPSTASIGVYVYTWDNPYPDKIIKGIDMVSAGIKTKPMIMGISLLKPETRAKEFWLGWGKRADIGSYTISPTKIVDRYNCSVAIYRGEKVITEELGLAQDASGKPIVRKVTNGKNIIEVQLVEMEAAKDRIKLNVNIHSSE